MVSLEALYSRLEELFSNGLLIVNQEGSNLANETTASTIMSTTGSINTTVSAINGKIITVDTNNVSTVWDQAVTNGTSYSGAKVLSIASTASTQVLLANPATNTKTARVKTIRVVGYANAQVNTYMGSYSTASGSASDIVNTGGGTPIVILNNKAGGAPSVMDLEYGGAYTINTSSRLEGLVEGGSGIFSIGGSEDIGISKEVPPGYAILLEVINTSSSTSSYSVRLEWWEE